MQRQVVHTQRKTFNQMEILSMIFFFIHNLFSLLFDFLCECITKLEKLILFDFNLKYVKANFQKHIQFETSLCEAAQHTVVLGFGLNAKTITEYIIYQIELPISTCGEFKLL